jgi:hypothetical protein
VASIDTNAGCNNPNGTSLYPKTGWVAYNPGAGVTVQLVDGFEGLSIHQFYSGTYVFCLYPSYGAVSQTCSTYTVVPGTGSYPSTPPSFFGAAPSITGGPDGSFVAQYTLQVQTAPSGPVNSVKDDFWVTVDGTPVAHTATQTVLPPPALVPVDANIQISPATDTNPVGSNHVLTITVNAVGGTIDAGSHTATANIESGPGSFLAGPSCSYAGGGATASCTVTITSATTGTTVVSATSAIPVNGGSITRTTGTAANTTSGGSGNASKNWADDNVGTIVRDAAADDITGTTVAAGVVVHDEATVTRAAGTPAAVPDPTGTVDFTLFQSGSCSGTIAATDPGKPLVAGGLATSVSFTTPGAGGAFSYQAHYSGDANYPARDGGCETLTVTPDAAHQLQTLLAAVTGVPPGASLAAKVRQIQAFVAANDNADACALLAAFINQVTAQRGKQLTVAQANSFTAQAQSIEATLGC